MDGTFGVTRWYYIEGLRWRIVFVQIDTLTVATNSGTDAMGIATSAFTFHTRQVDRTGRIAGIVFWFVPRTIIVGIRHALATATNEAVFLAARRTAASAFATDAGQVDGTFWVTRLFVSFDYFVVWFHVATIKRQHVLAKGYHGRVQFKINFCCGANVGPAKTKGGAIKFNLHIVVAGNVLAGITLLIIHRDLTEQGPLFGRRIRSKGEARLLALLRSSRKVNAVRSSHIIGFRCKHVSRILIGTRARFFNAFLTVFVPTIYLKRVCFGVTRASAGIFLLFVFSTVCEGQQRCTNCRVVIGLLVVLQLPDEAKLPRRRSLSRSESRQGSLAELSHCTLVAMMLSHYPFCSQRGRSSRVCRRQEETNTTDDYHQPKWRSFFSRRYHPSSSSLLLLNSHFLLRKKTRNEVG
jgi:hypothetical protein